ncbi:TPA: fimbrial biogenesis outer membrane usher protein, partial [Salmonella enterica]|nr:fimbrial biogenesis outer membrane usher protein [Salmonella enterica]
MKLTRLALLITLTLQVPVALATEFNADLLSTGSDSGVDLSAFSHEGYVAPGNYMLDIWLNNQSVSSQHPVRVVPAGDSGAAGGSVFCVTPSMVDMLGLKDDIVRGLKVIPGADGGHCLELRTTGSKVQYSAEEQRLTFIIPQAWLQYQDPDWVPPSRWSNGVTGALLDYNLTANRYMPQQGE